MDKLPHSTSDNDITEQSIAKLTRANEDLWKREETAESPVLPLAASGTSNSAGTNEATGSAPSSTPTSDSSGSPSLNEAARPVGLLAPESDPVTVDGTGSAVLSGAAHDTTEAGPPARKMPINTTAESLHNREASAAVKVMGRHTPQASPEADTQQEEDPREEWSVKPDKAEEISPDKAVKTLAKAVETLAKAEAHFAQLIGEIRAARASPEADPEIFAKAEILARWMDTLSAAQASPEADPQQDEEQDTFDAEWAEREWGGGDDRDTKASPDAEQHDEEPDEWAEWGGYRDTKASADAEQHHEEQDTFDEWGGREDWTTQAPRTPNHSMRRQRVTRETTGLLTGREPRGASPSKKEYLAIPAAVRRAREIGWRPGQS